MSKYLNDPREMAIQPEIGVTYEEDNRKEPMYHWGAKVLDLCGLPVSEYMKPMTVITNGGGGDDSGQTPTKRNVSMKIDIVSPDGDVISANGEVIDQVEGDGTWRARWTWDKDYNGVLAASVTAYDENSQEHTVNTFINDNADNEYDVVIENVIGNIVRIENFGIGTNASDTSSSTVTIKDTDANVDYVIKIEPNSSHSVVDYDIFYGAKSKSEELAQNELRSFTLYDANDGDGVNLEFNIPISEVYLAESTLFDNGEEPYDGDDAQELWDAWSTQYENANRYSFRIYIPLEIENDYTYDLYNDNAGNLDKATLVRKSTKEFDGVEYAEYINEDVNYAYDDKERLLKLKFIINDK